MSTTPPISQSLLILLVEDEELLHTFLEDGLEDAGFEIVVAACGTTASSELDSDAARFRAVLTDIRLGEGPTGWDVGRRARELVPDMPVVYMTGDSGHDWASKGVPNSVLVQKPFVMAQIVTAISSLLNKDSL